MHISDRGLRLIESFEGWSSRPYWDAYGRVWTRGFGETEGIHAGSPAISRQQGAANLKHLVEQRYEWAIRGLGVPLSQNQWDALCSFVWNLGAGIFTGHLRSALVSRRWHDAANIMLQYDHAGGVVLAGLSRRRREEVSLFLSDTKPPPPADPLAALLPPERRVVNSYDHYRRHPHVHPHGLAVTHAQMIVYRKLIWLAAVKGSDGHGGHLQPGWHIHNRAARYRILLDRTH